MPVPADPVAEDVPQSPPPEAIPTPARAQPAGGVPARRGVAWRQADEPGLGAWLRARWLAAPLWARWATGLLVLGVMALVGWRSLRPVEAVPEEDAAERAAAVARTAWAAARRQAPLPLAPGPDGSAFATGALEPGDAETASGLYVDFLSYATEDSTEFSVVATSAAFTPDVSVRTPDGRRLAASVLLGTGSRAEVVGLRGPGRFEIALTSAQPNASGAYEVSAGPVSALDTLRAERGTPNALRADTLGGARPRAGRFERAYALLAEPDRPVLVDVVSPAFAPQITLLGPAGEIRQQRTLERGAAGDSLYGVVLRFRPGWDLPYTLLVSSEEPEATGPFALEVRTVDVTPLAPNGRAIAGELGEESWLRDGRYVDAYRFRMGEGQELKVQLQSGDFAPAFQLWREETRGIKEAAAELNRAERDAIAFEKGDLQPGSYVLEVTSAEAGEAGVYPAGRYSLRVEASRPTPVTYDGDGGDGPRGWSAAVSGSARGRSPDGNAFTVSVSGISVSYPGGDRTRVELRVAVRSEDYAGPWAPWRSFAAKSALTDLAGQQYRPAASESAGTGVIAEPGAVRRGRLVFYADGARTSLRRVVFSAPLGGGSSVPIRLDLPR